MSRGKGRRWIPWAWALVLIGACGGSVVQSTDDGNAGGNAGAAGRGGAAAAGGGSARGGRGGVAGVSGVGPGGNSGTGAYAGAGGYAGSSGCVDQQCSPGLTCCNNNASCGSSSSNGSGYICNCAGGRWVCSPIDVDGGAGTCGPMGCPAGLSCCSGRCVNLANDPYSCGDCGRTCGFGFACVNSTCTVPTCAAEDAGDAGGVCCGRQVCTGNELCCSVYVGGAGPPQPACYPPSASGTCPVGCPTCE